MGHGQAVVAAHQFGVAPILVVADPETGVMTFTALLLVVWLAALAAADKCLSGPVRCRERSFRAAGPK